MRTDSELLRDFTEQKSEPAFTALVMRHLNLVYSAALRQVQSSHLAEEVAQSVFAVLAQDAHKLRADTILPAWLYQVARRTAVNVMRSESRRRLRETIAMELAEVNTPSSDWTHIQPLLDEAMETLNEPDRAAVLLRYFENKSLRDVGTTLGTSEDAAQKRLNRAVERLRDFFSKRKITISASSLAGLLSAHAVQMAPAGLAVALSSNVLAASGLSATLPFFSSLALLCRFKARAIFVCGVGLIALVIVIGQFYYTAPTRPADTTDLTPSSKQSIRARLSGGNVPEANSELDPFAERIAKLRAALRIASLENWWQSVHDAVQAFDPDLEVAFRILQEEASAYDPKRHPLEPEEEPTGRALLSMGFLGKSVPEAVPFLWQTHESAAGDTLRKMNCLNALQQIGFEPLDIPLLVDRVLKVTNRTESLDIQRHVKTEAYEKSQVAAWIATIIKESGAAAKPFLFSLHNALRDPHPGVRFWAACALLKHEGSTNSQVVAEINTALNDIHNDTLVFANEHIFKQAGRAAKGIVAALLKAARSSEVAYTRESALLTAAYIDPGVQKEALDVQELVTKDEWEKKWVEKAYSGNATFDDLYPELKNPRLFMVAVQYLGEMGPAAARALPAMIEALDMRKEPESYSATHKSIEKIDPKVAADYAPIDSEILKESVKAALRGQTAEQRSDLLTLLEEGYKPSRSGIVALTKKLVGRNREAGQAFAYALIERDPTLAAALQNALQ